MALVTTPERPPLDIDRLRAALVETYDVEVVDAAPSTNALVAQRARAGAAEGLVVVAEHQTAGRGRLDRTWTTPARSALTLSVLLRPGGLAPAHWPWLPLLTAVAVVRALPEHGPASPSLKWPNDVLLGGPTTGSTGPGRRGKVGGILVERVETADGPAAVVGVGLNVSMTQEELPVPSATSLALAGVEVDRTDLLVRLLRSLRREYDAWLRAGGDPDASGVRASYTSLCTTLGQTVRVDLPSGETLTGVATRIAPGGGLVVESGNRTATVGAGDIVHLREPG
jgi:BirA family biotin operon repressor/biotin-[acetyl-CoA-carboxylase] ligase